MLAVVVDKHNLCASFAVQLWIGSWTNFIGSVLRYVSTIHITHIGGGHYWLLMLGQALCAFAQAFGLFAPTKVAALWFAHDQRATANMLASMGECCIVIFYL